MSIKVLHVFQSAVLVNRLYIRHSGKHKELRHVVKQVHKPFINGRIQDFLLFILAFCIPAFVCSRPEHITPVMFYCIFKVFFQCRRIRYSRNIPERILYALEIFTNKILEFRFPVFEWCKQFTSGIHLDIQVIIQIQVLHVKALKLKRRIIEERFRHILYMIFISLRAK